MEQDFYDKLRESMDAERDFQPDPAEWETLQQRLENVSVTPVPFYFTFKFRLAMLTTFLLAISATFLLKSPSENLSLATIDHPSPTTILSTTDDQNESINLGVSQSLVKTNQNVDNQLVNGVDNNLLTNNRTQKNSYENEIPTATETDDLARLIVNENKVPQSDFSSTTFLSDREEKTTTVSPQNATKSSTKTPVATTHFLNQIAENKTNTLNALPLIEYRALATNALPQDTFIINQQIVQAEQNKKWRWQVAAYSTWASNTLSHFTGRAAVSLVQDESENEDVLGLGLKVSLLHKSKIRFTLHANNHFSSQYIHVKQVISKVTEEEYFSPDNTEIAEMTIFRNSVNTNIYEYGGLIEYFPFNYQRFKPYLGVGAYHLWIRKWQIDVTKDVNNFVQTVEIGMKKNGRTTLTPVIGVEYKFKNDFFVFTQGIGFFIIRDNFKYNSARIDVGMGYTF